MDENRVYELDFKKIEEDFNFSENDLRHCQGAEYKLLPYTVNEGNAVINFDGVVGSISRIIYDKKLEKDFNTDDFIENVIDQIAEFEGSNSKQSFKDIIQNMFIDNNTFCNFHIKTLNYISSTNMDEKIAKFLYSLFFDYELKETIKNQYDKNVENILYKLILNALPELSDKNYKNEGYKCYLPFIRNLFLEDLKFLATDEDLYKTSLKRFLEFYYMFYVSQMAIKLNQFESADLNNPNKIYYTLSFESISKNRTAYKYGWVLLKEYINDLFSHAITLEFLNHNNIEEQLGYKELFEIMSNDDGFIENQIESLCNSYISRRQDGIVWNDFKVKRVSSGNNAFDKVYKLFEAITFQFQGKTSKRARAKDGYKKWFIKFVENNFAKRRGSLGYNLNLTEEDIILLTKICIKNNEKLKLGLLFTEFEKRGISFDRDSKSKIIQLYEKLNLLEKKSDSGDAQYVRSIL